MDTVNKKYIQYHKDGKDPEFNKPITKAMITLEKGPFYPIPQWQAVHFCMGGLRINKDLQVVDIFGSPIPHLYAAGASLEPMQQKKSRLRSRQGTISR